MIVSRCGEYFVTAAQHVLPHDLCRHVRIARLGEVAVRGSANETTFTLRIEPAHGLAIWNDRGEWCAWCLIDAWATLLATTLSAATALIATASSIVTVIALAMLSPSSADLALLLTATAA